MVIKHVIRKSRTLFSPLELKIVARVWHALQWEDIIRIEIIMRLDKCLHFWNYRLFLYTVFLSNNLCEILEYFKNKLNSLIAFCFSPAPFGYGLSKSRRWRRWKGEWDAWSKMQWTLQLEALDSELFQMIFLTFSNTSLLSAYSPHFLHIHVCWRL